MIYPSNRVQIWASQLAANDFPPVCAMTGAPVETWRKFRFSTPPAWAYSLLVLIIFGLLGLIVAGIVMSAVGLKASGFMPLTRRSSRIQGLVVWLPVGLIIGAFALMTAVVIAAVANVGANDANLPGIGALLFFVGLLLLIAGFILRLVVTPLASIRGRVSVHPGYYDKLVELRNVHPAFVAAVRQLHQERAAQYAPTQSPVNVPLPPGSN